MAKRSILSFAGAVFSVMRKCWFERVAWNIFLAICITFVLTQAYKTHAVKGTLSYCKLSLDVEFGTANNLRV